MMHKLRPIWTSQEIRPADLCQSLQYPPGSSTLTMSPRFFSFPFFKSGTQSLYNIVLVSVVQQGESVTWIHVSLTFWTSSGCPIHLGHHKPPSPCTIQRVPTRHPSFLYLILSLFLVWFCSHVLWMDALAHQSGFWPQNRDFPPWVPSDALGWSK